MTLTSLFAWVADGLILLGSIVMTIGVVGVIRMPDIYTKLHAASKAVFLGVCSILVAVVDTGDPAIIARAALIGLLLIYTTPVSAHEIARAAAREALMRGDARDPIAIGSVRNDRPRRFPFPY